MLDLRQLRWNQKHIIIFKSLFPLISISLADYVRLFYILPASLFLFSDSFPPCLARPDPFLSCTAKHFELGLFPAFWKLFDFAGARTHTWKNNKRFIVCTLIPYAISAALSAYFRYIYNSICREPNIVYIAVVTSTAG